MQCYERTLCHAATHATSVCLDRSDVDRDGEVDLVWGCYMRLFYFKRVPGKGTFMRVDFGEQTTFGFNEVNVNLAPHFFDADADG